MLGLPVSISIELKCSATLAPFADCTDLMLSHYHCTMQGAMTAEPILFDGHYFSEIVLHTGNQGKCQD